jgi:hypothetical protein
VEFLGCGKCAGHQSGILVETQSTRYIRENDGISAKSVRARQGRRENGRAQAVGADESRYC